MAIDVVYAQGTEKVPLPDGRIANVVKGGHWPATDPVVRARPHLFTADPRFGLLYSAPPPGYDHNLNELSGPDPDFDENTQKILDALDGTDRDSVGDAEQATAAPGERRSVKRTRS